MCFTELNPLKIITNFLTLIFNNVWKKLIIVDSKAAGRLLFEFLKPFNPDEVCWIIRPFKSLKTRKMLFFFVTTTRLKVFERFIPFRCNNFAVNTFFWILFVVTLLTFFICLIMARRLNPLTLRFGLNKKWNTSIVSYKFYAKYVGCFYVLWTKLSKILTQYYARLVKLQIIKFHQFGVLQVNIILINCWSNDPKINTKSVQIKRIIQERIASLKNLDFEIKKLKRIEDSFQTFFQLRWAEFLTFWFKIFFEKLFYYNTSLKYIDPLDHFTKQAGVYLWFQASIRGKLSQYANFRKIDQFGVNISRYFDFLFKFPEINVLHIILQEIALSLETDLRHWPFLNVIRQLIIRGFWKKIGKKVLPLKVLFVLRGKIKGARRARVVKLQNNKRNIPFQKFLSTHLQSNSYFANTKYGTIGLHFYIWYTCVH